MTGVCTTTRVVRFLNNEISPVHREKQRKQKTCRIIYLVFKAAQELLFFCYYVLQSIFKN